MTDIEKLEYTKSFIDKLANGINPLDDTSKMFPKVQSVNPTI